MSSLEAQWRAVHETVGVYDASARDRLLLAGADRLEFVQGLCTHDVEKLPEGHALEAAFITPKGKLVADARLVKLDDALLFDAEAGRAAALDELFAKYRIHEDAQWLDAREALSVLELWGPLAATLLGRDALADGDGAAVSLDDHSFVAVGAPFGAVLYVPAGEAGAVREALVRSAVTQGGCEVEGPVVEAARIELGLGRFGVDWDEATNPLEAGLDRMLDYKKGCYVGQEVVAKATYIGHVNRRLVRLEWTGAPVAPGTALAGGRSPGKVTSCAQVPGTDRVVALGVVRRELAAAGSKHRVGDEAGSEATVLGYPFRSREKPV
jgi:folate-binding protein YgfZ